MVSSVPRHSTGLGEVEGPGVEEPAREGWRERGAAGITPGTGAAARGPEEALALARNVEGVAHGFVRHAAVAAVDGYIVAAIGRSWAFVELPVANRCRCSYSRHHTLCASVMGISSCHVSDMYNNRMFPLAFAPSETCLCVQ